MGELQGSRVGSRTRREAVLGVAALALGAGCSELTGPNPSEVADYSIPIDVHNNHDRGHTATVTIEGPDEQEYEEFGVRVPADTEVAGPPSRISRRPATRSFW